MIRDENQLSDDVLNTKRKEGVEKVAKVVNRLCFKIALGTGHHLIGSYEDFGVSTKRSAKAKMKYFVDLKADDLKMEDKKREQWLKSSEYLNTIQYPLVRFESTELVRDKSGGVTLFGLMTMRNIIREVTVQISELTIVFDAKERMFEKISFRTWIDRRLWGLQTSNETGYSKSDLSHQVLIEGCMHRRILNQN